MPLRGRGFGTDPNGEALPSGYDEACALNTGYVCCPTAGEADRAVAPSVTRLLIFGGGKGGSYASSFLGRNCAALGAGEGGTGGFTTPVAYWEYGGVAYVFVGPNGGALY